MDMMAICTGCQRPLPAKAPDRPCRKRLNKAGLGTGVDIGTVSQAEVGLTRERAWKVELVLRTAERSISTPAPPPPAGVQIRRLLGSVPLDRSGLGGDTGKVAEDM